MLFTELVDQCGSNPLCTATVRQQFTEHGTKAHDQRQTAQRSAHAGLDGTNYFVYRHSLHDTNRQSDQNQRDKAVQLKADHQQQ
ncbi:Uncharacterised protein [Serratia fonticola]|uniref:Uncharacterized protein n=1 Tax=Serratia fonticola TaxID=47917 RepID=A0A4U9TSX5_SERFO|nr:Uncharacterised protein [Serratia fonticola]